MNPFALIFKITPGIVKGIQSVVGGAASGATKQQMAKDALAAALESATDALDGKHEVYAQVAGAIAGMAIDQAVTVAKADGNYAKWTAIAATAQQNAKVADAVIEMVKTYEAP